MKILKELSHDLHFPTQSLSPNYFSSQLSRQLDSKIVQTNQHWKVEMKADFHMNKILKDWHLSSHHYQKEWRIVQAMHPSVYFGATFLLQATVSMEIIDFLMLKWNDFHILEMLEAVL